MDREGYTECVPRRRDGERADDPLLDLSAGYVQRAVAEFPKQGKRAPWKLRQDYVRDLLALRYGAVDDGVLELRSAARAARA
jgi:hypothetical protein